MIKTAQNTEIGNTWVGTDGIIKIKAEKVFHDHREILMVTYRTEFWMDQRYAGELFTPAY